MLLEGPSRVLEIPDGAVISLPTVLRGSDQVQLVPDPPVGAGTNHPEAITMIPFTGSSPRLLVAYDSPSDERRQADGIVADVVTLTRSSHLWSHPMAIAQAYFGFPHPRCSTRLRRTRSRTRAINQDISGRVDAVDLIPELLGSRVTQFALWRPAASQPPPTLVIGRFVAADVPRLEDESAWSWAEILSARAYGRLTSTPAVSMTASITTGSRSWSRGPTGQQCRLRRPARFYRLRTGDCFASDASTLRRQRPVTCSRRASPRR